MEMNPNTIFVAETASKSAVESKSETSVLYMQRQRGLDAVRASLAVEMSQWSLAAFNVEGILNITATRVSGGSNPHRPSSRASKTAAQIAVQNPGGKLGLLAEIKAKPRQ